MPRGGFDFRRRRDYPGWGARAEWPPVNPVPTDPNIYTYLSPGTIVDPEPCPDPTDCPPVIGGIPDPPIILSLSPSHSTGLAWGVAGNTGSAVWPTSNLAVFFPFVVADSYVATTGVVYNGATASGNIDIGIYNSAGTRLASNGGTAQSGTSTLQLLTFSASTTLAAGSLYFMGLVLDNTTGTVQRMNAFGNMDAQGIGIKNVAASYPLPSTVTYATVSSTIVPVMGISRLASF